MPSDDVINQIINGLKTEWDDPDNVGIPYSTADGSYQGEALSTYDLFNEIDWPSDNKEFRQDLVDSILSSQWCSADYYSGARVDALRDGWNRLSNRIKHITRYLFLKTPDAEKGYGDYRIDPADILDELERELRGIGLERDLPSGKLIYRCRIHDTREHFTLADDLGPPPVERALSSRMSPVGIPIFYGAADIKTAILETFSPELQVEGKIATVCSFEVLRDLRILDLTDLPAVPSLYDAQKRHLRDGISFLNGFVLDIAKPIDRDDKEHLAYFPTQVVSEYIRHVYTDRMGNGVDGIVYNSSVHSGGKCYALFVGKTDCCDNANRDGKTLLLKTHMIQRKELPGDHQKSLLYRVRHAFTWACRKLRD